MTLHAGYVDANGRWVRIENDESEFGLPVGYNDPNQYRGIPAEQPSRTVNVDNDIRI